MIDIGLSKIVLIGLVALVVVGPQRLPKVARMGGTLFGRAQRYINEVKTEVSREIELEQLQKMKQDLQEAASSVQQTMTENAALLERELSAMSAVAEPATVQLAPESFAPYVDSTAPASTAPEQIALSPEWVRRKSKNFRQKKLARASSIPSWYKRQNGTRTCASSGAARAARTRPDVAAAGFFH